MKQLLMSLGLLTFSVISPAESILSVDNLTNNTFCFGLPTEISFGVVKFATNATCIEPKTRAWFIRSDEKESKAELCLVVWEKNNSYEFSSPHRNLSARISAECEKDFDLRKMHVEIFRFDIRDQNGNLNTIRRMNVKKKSHITIKNADNNRVEFDVELEGIRPEED